MNPQHIDSVSIWDCEGFRFSKHCVNVLWSGPPPPGQIDAVCIQDFIEENSRALRARYLAWVYELGELRVDNSRLVDHFTIRPGFSYWWMTLIAEKCNFAKSPHITDAIRLLAFDQWASQFSGLGFVRLNSNNKVLRECLKKWCELKNIQCEFRDVPSDAKTHFDLRQLFSRLPYKIQAGVWLTKYVVDRWCLRGIGVREWRSEITMGNSVTFISYLSNLSPRKGLSGRLKSDFWSELPDLLAKEGAVCRWVQLYVKNRVTPTPKSAANLLKRMAKSDLGRQVHVSLDSFLGFTAIARAINDYVSVYREGKSKFVEVSRSQLIENQSVDAFLWPLFKKDWELSFFGVDALRNLLHLNLFEKMLSELPRQSVGVYLQENQGWEFAMIQAWRSSMHGKLIGFPHSTVRFWDLRYFFDERTYSESRAALPRPNFVAVSGKMVAAAYLEGRYPDSELLEVEALRFLYLGGIKNRLIRTWPTSSKKIRILILGDYSQSSTRYLIDTLWKISSELSKFDLTVKPHPACPIDFDDNQESMFCVSNQPLVELLPFFDVVVSGSATSAAVDAYAAGLQVISIVDSFNLNLSPLRGVTGVRFVRSPTEVKIALEELPFQSDRDGERVDYFNVDLSLRRWRVSLLNGKESCEL